MQGVPHLPRSGCSLDVSSSCSIATEDVAHWSVTALSSWVDDTHANESPTTALHLCSSGGGYKVRRCNTDTETHTQHTVAASDPLKRSTERESVCVCFVDLPLTLEDHWCCHFRLFGINVCACSGCCSPTHTEETLVGECNSGLALFCSS